MKLGGSIPFAYPDAEGWAAEAARVGYSAITWQVPVDADDDIVNAYLRAAERHDIAIAEVGVWRNTLSSDASERHTNMEYAKRCLAVAEKIGAPCCVNIAGTPGTIWDGGYRENYSAATYKALIDSVREIIDAVKPRRTYYTIEPMPWQLPDGPDSYLKLIEDVDRDGFAVHLDFVNMINCPRRFLEADAFLEDCLIKLGPYTRSVHIKDAFMEPKSMPCVIRECPPGQGTLDYRKLLPLLDGLLPKGTPVLLEHMGTVEEYERSFRYLAGIAGEIGVAIR